MHLYRAMPHAHVEGMRRVSYSVVLYIFRTAVCNVMGASFVDSRRIESRRFRAEFWVVVVAGFWVLCGLLFQSFWGSLGFVSFSCRFPLDALGYGVDYIHRRRRAVFL